VILLRGVFPYYGGKSKIAEKIVSLFPEHKVYVEPFGGAASVLLTKPPSPIEVYNDLNEEVVNFFQVLRERLHELQLLLYFTPYARAEFERCLEPSGDRLERARKTFVRQRMGFSGVQRLTRGNWSYSKSQSAGGMAKAVNAFRTGIDYLTCVAERFAGVQIECLPALEVIKRYDSPDTLVYADPPYPLESRCTEDMYELEMSEDAHRELAAVLNSIKGKALVSGYSCSLYNELYADWNRLEFQSKAHAKLRAGESRSDRVEVVWANYELPIGR